jgi:hypothetical protein
MNYCNKLKINYTINFNSVHYVGLGYIIIRNAINLYHTTRRHIAKDNHHIHHFENVCSLLPTHTGRMCPPIIVASKKGLKRPRREPGLLTSWSRVLLEKLTSKLCS